MTKDYKNLASNKLRNEEFVNSLHLLADTKDISVEQLKGLYEKNAKISSQMTIDEFVQDFSVRLSELKIYQDQYLSGTKSFADIAMGGPKNISEVALMEAACSLLTPDELQDSIVSKKSVSDVFSMIDKSQVKKRTLELVLERQNQIQQEQLLKMEKQKEIKSVWRDKVASQKSNETQQSHNLPKRGI